MVNYLLLSVFLFISFSGLSQCPDEDLHFNIQQDIEDFISAYPDCEEIKRNLSLNGSINDLTPLAGIKKIGGSLFLLELTDLNNLKGLENLRTINISLVANTFNSLHNFEGLEGLEKVNKISVQNRSIKNLDGLSGLDTIQNIEIVNSIDHNLKNLNGLKANFVRSMFINFELLDEEFDIKEVTDLILIGQGKLTNSYLDKLTDKVLIINTLNIDSISFELISTDTTLVSLNLWNTEVLDMEDIDSYEDLTYLTIEDNDTLINSNYLSRSKVKSLSIGGSKIIHLNNLTNPYLESLALQVNPNLYDLSELEDFKNLKDIYLRDNILLDTCNYDIVCDLIESGNAIIVGNGINCSSVDVVASQCTSSTLDLNNEQTMGIIYPNPCDDVLYIDSDFDIEALEVFTIQGNLLLRKTRNTSSIDVKELDYIGAVVLKIYSRAGVQVHKLLLY